MLERSYRNALSNGGNNRSRLYKVKSQIAYFHFFSFTIDALITKPQKLFKNIDSKNFRTRFSVGVHRRADFSPLKCEKLTFLNIFSWLSQFNVVLWGIVFGNASFSHFWSHKSAHRYTPTLHHVRIFFKLIFLKKFFGSVIITSIVNEKKWK